MAERERFVVDAADAGLRLDQVLPRHIAGLSRRKARVVIDVGGVFVDRARVKVASRPVRPGQEIEVHLGGVLARASGEVGAAARARDDAALPAFAVVFEDGDVIVVDKPAGLITAPTPESDRGNLADLLSRRKPPLILSEPEGRVEGADLLSRRDGAAPVFVVHRIDRPTSGLLVFAKTDAANRALSAAFVAHAVEREYHAVAVGEVAAAETIDAVIDGRRAVTHVAPVEALRGATLVACRLETGRTHQIRIHLARIGHPVAGDAQHGQEVGRGFTPRPPRLALHARVLGFAHPRTGTAMRFESPWPEDLAAWLAALRT